MKKTIAKVSQSSCKHKPQCFF